MLLKAPMTKFKKSVSGIKKKNSCSNGHVKVLGQKKKGYEALFLSEQSRKVSVILF